MVPPLLDAVAVQVTVAGAATTELFVGEVSVQVGAVSAVMLTTGEVPV